MLSKRILQFEIGEFVAGKLAVWLLTSDQIYVAVLDASGSELVTETLIDTEEKSKNLKKRPHQEDESHSTSKKARTSLSLGASPKSHSLAQSRRLITPALLKTLVRPQRIS